MPTAASKAKAKYNAKNYRQYSVCFKLDSDAELIQAIEEARKNGTSAAEFIRSLYEASKAGKE